MTESARRLRANRLVAGKRCGWCREPLEFGEEAAVCVACQALHHASCWDERAGCARKDCVHAPLTRVAPPPAPPPVPAAGAYPHAPPGHGAPVLACARCGAAVAAGTVCGACGLPAPGGAYPGAYQQNAPGAVAALVCGILGIVVCYLGIVLAIIAWVQARKARNAIEVDPRLAGAGMAMAGLILGIIGTCIWGIYWVVVVAMIIGHA